MPIFPVHQGQPPACLHPIRLSHYFQLAYWLYFRPTLFKSYLYRADPQLYQAGWGWQTFTRAWRAPAYRNLYLMLPGLVLLLSILVGLPITLVTSWLQGTPPDWIRWIVGLAVGVVISIELGLTLGVVVSVAFGIAGGVVIGVIAGVIGSLALGLGVGPTFSLAASLIGGMLGSIAVGAAWSMARGVAAGAAFGAAVSIILAIISGFMGAVQYHLAVGLILALLSSLGVLRLPIYLLQLGPALWPGLWTGNHPVTWDELTILPLPGTRAALARHLRQAEAEDFRLLAEITRNPFQRWAVQRVLQRYLHTHPTPLHFLYEILVNPQLATYVFAPANQDEWARLPAIRQLLLGELAGQRVDYHPAPVSRLAEQVIWGLTHFLRDRRQTPLTRFAGMLYDCLDSKRIEAKDFDLLSYPIYTSLGKYPGGEEMFHSLTIMATFLTYDELTNLATVTQLIQPLASASRSGQAIRPTVLTALTRLADIGQEIITYQAATNRVNQLAALARATAALDTLDEYIRAEVTTPEQMILGRIVRQWRRLINEAGGRVGHIQVMGPVTNPYIAGNPVTGGLFVGRQDILRRLEELWGGAGQSPSVVLYGHRRMGKTSILHNLGQRFGPHTVIVNFNMQRVGLVTHTGEILYNLALALYDSLRLSQSSEVFETSELLEPEETHFTLHNPYTAFDRFLRQLDRGRAGRRFILTVDEFELIERMINDGQLEIRLLDFWRGLIQTYPWYIMAFAGLHTLQEMTQDYWHPLFGSVTGIPVSFLSHEAARRLLTQPTPDFALDYDPAAVACIISLTHGQPYLIQLIGHGLVTRFNRQTFEEGLARSRRFTVADVEAIINAPEFYRDGNAYFTGIWAQAKQGPPGQQLILQTLTDGPASAEELSTYTNLPLSQTLAALQTLERHDVIQQVSEAANSEWTNDPWRYTVELMRRWVAQRLDAPPYSM